MNTLLIRRQRFLGVANWPAGWRRYVPWLMARWTLFVYEREGDTQYVASATITTHGCAGMIDTLNGRRFYDMMTERGIEPFAPLGLTTMHAEAEPGHVRLMQYKLRRVAEVRDEGASEIDGIALRVVKIIAKVDS